MILVNRHFWMQSADEPRMDTSTELLYTKQEFMFMYGSYERFEQSPKESEVRWMNFAHRVGNLFTSTKCQIEFTKQYKTSIFVNAKFVGMFFFVYTSARWMGLPEVYFLPEIQGSERMGACHPRGQFCLEGSNEP